MFLSVLVLGKIPILRARTCCINEDVRVSGRTNERDQSGAIHIVKDSCGNLVDTITSTETQWARIDVTCLICNKLESHVCCRPAW
jgi:hypothetical protein